MIEQDILDRLKGYTDAFYRKDFDAVIEYLYPEEVQSLRSNLQWMAKAMRPFGETESFKNMFRGIDKLEDLEQLTDRSFIAMFFAGATREFSKHNIQRIVNSIEVLEVDHADYIANVRYRFINIYAEDQTPEYIESDVNLIYSDDTWYMLFTSNIEEAFLRYRDQLEQYEHAKTKDQTSLSKTPDEDIESFPVYGFRHASSERIIIQPRFRQVGDFSEGLAPVRVFSKWGFIDRKGELVIKPQYDRAYSFSQGLALVQHRGAYGGRSRCGFINKQGQWVIHPQYEYANPFSDDLAGVYNGEFWGFIDRDGNLIIPFEYDSVGMFKEGLARVERNDSAFYIDTEGQYIKEADDDDEWGFEDDDDDDELF